MIISLIAAIGRNRVIGKDNKMMWHLPEEYKYFRETTLGHCIILGRKNFEAVGRPLPKRTNIIVTRNKSYRADGCVVFDGIGKALNHAKSLGEREVFICGGGEIYCQALSLANKIYLTYVDFEEEGDVYFPEFDESLYEKKLVRKEDRWEAFVYTRLSNL